MNKFCNVERFVVFIKREKGLIKKNHSTEHHYTNLVYVTLNTWRFILYVKINAVNLNKYYKSNN